LGGPGSQELRKNTKSIEGNGEIRKEGDSRFQRPAAKGGKSASRGDDTWGVQVMGKGGNQEETAGNERGAQKNRLYYCLNDRVKGGTEVKSVSK